MTRLSQIPSKEDWGNYERDFDTKYAYEKFGGKTLEEVMVYVETAALGASECLSYMPEIPFQYYIFSFEKFLITAQLMDDEYAKTEATGGASTFLRLVLDKLTTNPWMILPVMEELMPVLEYVSSHQSYFDADIEIYGSFSALLEQIKGMYQIALNSERQKFGET
jgi:hypothetical protein